MDSPKFYCIKHDEPVKSPKSFIRYYTNITKISPNGRNDILLISDLYETIKQGQPIPPSP